MIAVIDRLTRHLRAQRRREAVSKRERRKDRVVGRERAEARDFSASTIERITDDVRAAHGGEKSQSEVSDSGCVFPV